MLKAFKTQLEQLAKDPKDPFTASVRKIVGPREAVHVEAPLRRMIVRIPDMVSQIRRWSEAPGVSPEIKRLHEFALAYLYNPTDFLPEKVHGLFGYLDDAYLVGSVYDATMKSDDWAELKPLCDDVGLSIEVPDWLEMTRRLLPEETGKIEEMLELIELHRPPNAFSMAR